MLRFAESAARALPHHDAALLDVIIVSTRAPKEPISGGMARAVSQAAENFHKRTWYALINRKDLAAQFSAASDNTPLPEEGSVRKYAIQQPAIDVREIVVSHTDWDAFYNKIINGVVWPMCHGHFDKVDDHTPELYDATIKMNELMAEKIAENLNGNRNEKTPIWIHDYHHFSLGTSLKARGIENPIVFFNHIPLPDPDRVQEEMSEDNAAAFGAYVSHLQHCDVVNFQNAETARRFMRYVGVEPVDLDFYESVEIKTTSGHTLKVGNFPITINPEKVERIAQQDVGTALGKNLQEQMVADNIFINFERCDYSKGILDRVLAFKQMLIENPGMIGKAQLVLGAEPTRKDIKEYVEYAKTVTAIVEEINSNPAWQFEKDGKVHHPVILNNKSVENEDVLRLMQSGRRPGQNIICCATAATDGMNLVVKEFIASQNPSDPGVVMMSTQIGAAAELVDGAKGAVSYNPYEGGFKPKKGAIPNFEPIKTAMLECIRLAGSEEWKQRYEWLHERVWSNPLSLWAEENAHAMRECIKNHEKTANAELSVGHSQPHLSKEPL